MSENPRASRREIARCLRANGFSDLAIAGVLTNFTHADLERTTEELKEALDRTVAHGDTLMRRLLRALKGT